MANYRNYDMGSGKDWNVKDTIAYGAGVVHDDFIGLQADLNLFASQLGYQKLDLDGKLGAETVDAFNAVYKAAIGRNPNAATLPPVGTKEQLASMCQQVRVWFHTQARAILLAGNG